MHKAAKHVRRRSECDCASKQSWREPTCRRASVAPCVITSTEEIQTCPAETIIQPQEAGDSGRVCYYLFPISVPYIALLALRSLYHPSLYAACMRRPGCFPGAWDSWHLQVASLHLITDLCPLHLHGFILSFPCERE